MSSVRPVAARVRESGHGATVRRRSVTTSSEKDVAEWAVSSAKPSGSFSTAFVCSRLLGNASNSVMLYDHLVLTFLPDPLDPMCSPEVRLCLEFNNVSLLVLQQPGLSGLACSS